ncbi:MAG: EAL domain-containing protein [Thermodesulfovibrionales bacterium]|nr:EAL domain-containing protein [Thermodesulfovibrionales bacterium]
MNEIPLYNDLIGKIKEILTANSSISLLYIDCSKITKIEQVFGKKIYGDILREIKGAVLDMKGKEIMPEDIVATDNLDGSEFLVFLSKKPEEKDFSTDGFDTMCKKVSGCLNGAIFPITFPYLQTKPKISVGYSIILHNPLIKEERLINKLIEDAKLMAGYREFKRLVQTKETLQELIIKEDISTFFQPVVNLNTFEIIGYEALSRGPEHTEYRSPAVLFDAAAETGLLLELDRLCRKKALLNARSLSPRYKLFINCLPSAIHDPEFKDEYLKAFIKEVAINPANIILEVTEREAVENFDSFKKAVTYYSDTGFAVAVDNTGLGFSSLEMVVELKPQFIKLAMTVIRGIDKNILKQELVKAISSLSEKINSIIIAEGIETQEELKVLQDIGIPYGQGFLFAHPAFPFPGIKRF